MSDFEEDRMPRDPRPIRNAVRTAVRCSVRTSRFDIDLLESRQLMAVELISNGAFANDSADWALTGSFHADDTYQTFRSAPGYAYLAGSSGTLATSSNLTGTLQQTISLPSTTASANLTFWYRTATEDGTPQADSLAVRIRNTAGTVLQTLTTLYNQSLGAYAQSPVFNLASFAGQTIVLSFEGQTNASAGTVFRIDDVSLQATSSVSPVIPAPTLAYPGAASSAALGMPVVNTPVPGFTWNAVGGAVGYGLTLEKLVSGTTYTTVFDSDTNPNTSGKPITGTNFTVPMALGAGTYRWSLRAYDDAVTVTAATPPLYFTLNTSGYTRALGIDVSKWQTITGTSAWQSIKTNGTSGTTADDTSFVWAKASQGVGSPDATYATKAADAHAAGVTFGAYHYGTPNNGGSTIASMTADAVAEANDFYSRISTTLFPGNLVPMLDFEDPDVTQDQTLLSHWLNAFCERLTALTQMTPVIYSGQYYAYAHLNPSVVRYPIWIAQYPSTMPNPQTASPSDPDGSGVRLPQTPWPTWSIWQYTSSGTVAGYAGNIDRDVFNGDVNALEQFKIKDNATFTVIGTLFEDVDGDGVHDAEDAGISGRTVFLDANGNGTIDTGERTAVTNSSGVYSFAGLLTGNYQLRQVVPGTSIATTAASQSFKIGAGLANVAHDFGSQVIDATPPTLADSRFNYDSPARTITLVFSEDIGTSLDAAKVSLTSGATTVPVTFTYDPATWTAVFTPTGTLADGDYVLTLESGAVRDSSNNSSAPINVPFFWLAGDINRDRTVNFSDLVILAQNYNQPGSYATGDLTGDGNVGFEDLVLLAQAYGHSLTPVAPLMVASVAAPASLAGGKKRVAPSVLA